MSKVPGEYYHNVLVGCQHDTIVVCILLCPNLEGSEDAPATAKRGEAKNVFSAASMFASRFWPRVVVMCE